MPTTRQFEKKQKENVVKDPFVDGRFENVKSSFKKIIMCNVVKILLPSYVRVDQTEN